MVTPPRVVLDALRFNQTVVALCAAVEVSNDIW